MRMPLAFLMMVMVLASGGAWAQAPAPLQGDAAAVERVEAMFARMGGRDRWAKARSMYLHYRQQVSGGNRPGPGEERAWRDLTAPRERMEFTRTSYAGDYRAWGRGFDAAGAWSRLPDGMRAAPPEQHARILAFWKRDFYTLLRRMAAGDPDLAYGFTAPHRVTLTDRGQDIGWWEIDSGGSLLRWGADDDEGGTLSYVYGPMQSFGAIAFPAWGSSSDGQYRFEYRVVAIADTALPAAALADPAVPPPADLTLR